jgi:hypothetical protein
MKDQEEKEKIREIEEGRERKRKDKEASKVAKDEAKKAHLESIEQER